MFNPQSQIQSMSAVSVENGMRMSFIKKCCGVLLVFSGLLPSIVIATDLANGPLANGLTSNATVKPNIAFVVDDSGSMDFENMPDDDGTNKGGRCYGSSQYNTLFYDPTYTYKPPFKIDGTLYSDGVKRFDDAKFSEALKDGYFERGKYTFGGNVSSNTATNLNTLSNLTPGSVSCSARATITVSGGNSSTSVSRITVNGTNIMSSASNASSDSNNVASNIASRITANNYTATANGNVVTIYAPYSAGNVTVAPIVTVASGSKILTPAAFSAYASCGSSSSKYYYSRLISSTSNACESDASYTIVTDSSQIVAPTGVDAKTNYANWYSYYRKRAYLMKASAGEAFKDLDESKYRVGLFFINSVESGAKVEVSNPSSHRNNDFKIDDFSGTASGSQRYEWFNKLYASRKDGSTPLRGALSRMGRMYAGQISGWDPVQYSCQQNFTILSTDGFWNDGAEINAYGPKKLNGSDSVGNTDGGAADAIPATARITVTGGNNSNSAVSQITVGGVNLMSNASTASTSGTTVAANIASQITLNGYSASASGSVITITAPISQIGLNATPVVTVARGTKTYSVSAFSGSANATTGAPLPYKDALGQLDTLADVSYYYYQTDLRTDNCSNTIGSTTYTELCENNVRGSGKDLNSQQHMTSFTIGLGVSGSIKYENGYENPPQRAPGDTNIYYSNIVNGTADWPRLNPDSDTDRAKIDDLWHAAVNGRGTYYSAANANSLKVGIQSALQGVDIKTGSSAAAATSNLQPVAGDNYAYVALYQTVKWDGDLKAYTIDPSDGTISKDSLWSAQAKLDAQVTAAGTAGDGRTIKYFSSGATNNLKEFNYANLEADGLKNNFDNICGKVPMISQCGTTDGLDDTQKTVANTGGNLVNYLRGRSVYENETSNAVLANRIYRGREHVLGDIVNAVPAYVKKPPFNYDYFDTTYATFKTTYASRMPNVYVAANDGMLHAFNAGNGADTSDGNEGTERWAYIPRLVMPNLWRLANGNYANDHQYSVDGSPIVADICDSPSRDDVNLCLSDTHWKTILVAGLNKGGCGYYALDITEPEVPKGLWEFTNANLGYSFGNPIVTKNKNGRWVVIVSSGYNNYDGGCGSSGDGNGHIFVLDAATGELLDDIPTYTSGIDAAGTPGAPSGLAQLNVWIDNPRSAVADRLYGGDLLGNVWRIDFDDNYLPAGKEAVLIARVKDGAATPNAQPITVRPELAEISVGAAKYPIVLVGTGRYLGEVDIKDRGQQSVYGLKDMLTSTSVVDVRGGTLASRTLTETNGTGALAGRVIRTISGDTLDWATQDGWYIDFNPSNRSPGERVTVQMSLDSSVLTLAANVPSPNACTADGYAFLYSLDISNGKNIANALNSAAGVRLAGNALVAGIKTVTLSSGKKVVIITDTAGGIGSDALPTSGGGPVGAARRTSWREIVD